MRVAIIYPEVYDIARFGKKRKEFPPFGVLYLATIVSAQNGMQVEIFSVKSDQDILDLTRFDVIAFSIPSSVTYHVIKSVRFKSLHNKGVFMIAGGVHATIFPEKTLRDLKVHAVAIGQGDEAILELLREKEVRRFSNIKGICYLENNNVIFSEKRILKKIRIICRSFPREICCLIRIS